MATLHKRDFSQGADVTEMLELTGGQFRFGWACCRNTKTATATAGGVVVNHIRILEYGQAEIAGFGSIMSQNSKPTEIPLSHEKSHLTTEG